MPQNVENDHYGQCPIFLLVLVLQCVTTLARHLAVCLSRLHHCTAHSALMVAAAVNIWSGDPRGRATPTAPSTYVCFIPWLNKKNAKR